MQMKGKNTEILECEWCGIRYPKGGYPFYRADITNMTRPIAIKSSDIKKGKYGHETHIICKNCHESLREI